MGPLSPAFRGESKAARALPSITAPHPKRGGRFHSEPDSHPTRAQGDTGGRISKQGGPRNRRDPEAGT